MAIETPSSVTVVAPNRSGHSEGSYVDWPAIIGGIVLASAISLLLLTFGSAIGLSLANFEGREGAAPVFLAIAAALWLLWVQVSSFMAGGYLTGRMRRRAGDAGEHEVHVRDGAHGLLVWAGALIIGALIAVNGIGTAANAVGNIASTATQAASNVAGEAAGAIDPNAYFVDTLFRPAAGAAAPEGAGTDPRAEATRILATSAVNGEMSADDRAYLAQSVAASTGMSEADAQARVEQVMGSVDQARAQAADAAETARRTSVIAAFLVAASLLVSAIGAYWAATMGGRHRDEGTVFATVFRRF